MQAVIQIFMTPIHQSVKFKFQIICQVFCPYFKAKLSTIGSRQIIGNNVFYDFRLTWPTLKRL